jgi:hypothetical protein
VQHSHRHPVTVRSITEISNNPSRPNGDEHQPENSSNDSIRQDDFAHSSPFTATVVRDTIRQKSPFHTKEHLFLKDNLNLRSKLNFSGESGNCVSPSIFNQGNRVPTQLTTVNDPSHSVATTRKSQPIRSDIFRDALNTQSPLEHYYIVNYTYTACNENIYHVDTNKIKHAPDICSSAQSRVPFKMASSIKLDKFKGDVSQHPSIWWNQLQQWIDLYDIPQETITKRATFQFSDYAQFGMQRYHPKLQIIWANSKLLSLKSLQKMITF